jgi:purine-binding chemotaxis protein CheW
VSTDDTAIVRYGVFRLGGMQFGLPVDALREVVPCATLDSLPARSPLIAGGIDLRGTVLPVLDLRRLFHQPHDRLPEPAAVVVTVSNGRLIGLLAEGVCGIFGCAGSAVTALDSSGASLPVICGGFPRSDDGTLVSLLSPAALAALPEVPTVADPRGNDQGASAEPPDGHALTHLILMRSGDVSFALPSGPVCTTLFHPPITRSALSHGCCLGVLEHAGMRVPAVDLNVLCGFARAGESRDAEAVVLNFDDGRVALVVDEIIDVVDVDTHAVVPVDHGMLPVTALLAGVLPLDAMPVHATRKATQRKGYYLLLDAASVANSATLGALAKLNTPAADAASRVDDTHGRETLPGERIITYDIGVEVATPIRQIAEILPWSSDALLGDVTATGTALLVSRGRAIPTWCLSTLFGREPPPRSPTSSVLVVEIGGRPVGFSVSRLMSIDEARTHGVARSTAASELLRARSLPHCTVGSGDQDRLLGLMDLEQVAAALMA